MENIEKVKNKHCITNHKLEDVVNELKSIRRILHPDNNGGQFKSDEHKNDYIEVNDIIVEYESTKSFEVLDTQNNQINELIKVVKELIPTKEDQKEVMLEKKLRDDIISFSDYRKKKLIVPKISTVAITGVLSYLWLFPVQISEHPVLSRYIDINNPIFTFIWLTSIFISIYTWIVLNYFEMRKNALLEKLKLKSFHNELFMSFLEVYGSNKTFTKQNFIGFLVSGNMMRNPINLKHLDNCIVEDLANIILNHAVDKNLISIENAKSFDDVFLIM